MRPHPLDPRRRGTTQGCFARRGAQAVPLYFNGGCCRLTLVPPDETRTFRAHRDARYEALAND